MAGLSSVRQPQSSPCGMTRFEETPGNRPLMERGTSQKKPSPGEDIECNASAAHGAKNILFISQVKKAPIS